MSFLEAHIQSFGEFYYKNRHYVLISKPYPYVAKDVVPYYNADAICANEKRSEDGYQVVYNCRWPMKNQHQVDYCVAQVTHEWEKAQKIGEQWGITDESLFVDDWNQPMAVNETMQKYNIETISRLNAWD